MSGTIEGARKAVITIKERYGDGHRQRIGRLGGLKSQGGGFTYDRELAQRAGAKGGRNRWVKIKAQRLAEQELLKEL